MLFVPYDETKRTLRFDTTSVEVLDTDVCVARLDEQTFSQLGLAKPTIGLLDDTMTNMAQVTAGHKELLTSFGALTVDPNIFGGLIYHGSTQSGFSGAPYCRGSQLLGIHLAGGMLNYGVSASYILALTRKPESTAEWLEKIRKRGGKIKWRRSPYNPDEVVVEVDGQFHVVDRDMVEEEEQEDETTEQRRNYVQRVAASAATRDSYFEGLGKKSRERLIRATGLNRAMYADALPQRSTGEEELERYEKGMDDYAPEVYQDGVISRPVYEDDAKRFASEVDEIVVEQQSKNVQLAEMKEVSAESLKNYEIRHQKVLDQLDEKVMLLQELQNSVADRYREVQKLLMEVPKGSTSRTPIVQECEQLKTELTIINSAKKHANVRVSSVKAKPEAVRKAKAAQEGATIYDRMRAQGFVEEDVRKAYAVIQQRIAAATPKELVPKERTPAVPVVPGVEIIPVNTPVH